MHLLKKFLGKLSSRFQEASLLTQLMLIFILTSVIPILFVQIFNYSYLHRNLENRSLEVISTNVSQLTKTFNAELNSVEDLINGMVYDSTFIKHVQNLDSTYPNVAVNAKLDLSRDITSASYSNSYIAFSMIELPSGNSLYINQKSTSSVLPIMNQETQKTILNNLSLHLYKNIFSPTEYIDFRGNSPSSYCFSISRVIYNGFSGDPYGIFTIYLDERFLYDQCEEIFEPYNSEGNKLFIVNSQNQIVSDMNRSNLGLGCSADEYLSRELLQEIFKADGQFSKQVSIDSERYILSSAVIPRTDWHLVFLVKSSSVTQETDVMLKISIGMCLAILCVTFFIFTGITSKISRSIRQIITGINKAKGGDFKQKVTVDNKNELTMIANSFNSLTETVDHLIHELHDQMEQTNQAIKNEKDAELNALEAQINPHFLYNTIDTINWVAIDHEEYEISSMLSQLGSMLRYSISGVNHTVSVYQEAKWLQEYLFLQKKRFSESFDYKIEFQESILDCKIHKLLFQPIVENSIIHGFKGRDSGGFIDICGFQKDEQSLQFTISDNGVGMTPEELEYILSDVQKERQSIGVLNVSCRLKAYYGERASFSIKSVPQKGTVCTLTIPLVR